VNFLQGEFWTSIAIALAFILWFAKGGGNLSVNTILFGNRSAVYGALATIFGSLLGFVIASISIIMSLPDSPRLDVVRNSKHYPDLWQIFTSATKSLAVATGAALIGLVFDRDAEPIRFVLYLCVWTTVLATLRVYRCIWALERLVGVLVASNSNRNPASGNR
jgi:FtsH-binding integral membrane protein